MEENNTIRVAHFSDLHGMWRFIEQKLPYLEDQNGEVELLINTGDFLPNIGRPVNPEQEMEFQANWFKQNKDGMFAAFGNRPVVTVDGNHDFLCLGDLLKENDYQGEVLTIRPGEVVTYKNKTFAGFSEIPYIMGEWNREVQGEELKRLSHLTLQQGAEILLTHVPPAGILSGLYGANELTNALFYTEHNTKVHLFGHVHSEGGRTTEENGMKFYNSACSISIIKI